MNQTQPVTSPLKTTILTSTYTQIQTQLQVDLFFSNLRSQCQLKKQQEKQILPKMRVKLLQWLQKLATVTFKHSQQSYLTSVIILDQYLLQVDELPSKLQLLGCTALLIASKLKEESIVAPECYATACCNTFTQQQLLLKQRDMYGLINWKNLKNGVLQGVKIGCKKLQMQNGLKKGWEFLGIALKQQKCLSWSQSLAKLSGKPQNSTIDVYQMVHDI